LRRVSYSKKEELGREFSLFPGHVETGEEFVATF